MVYSTISRLSLSYTCINLFLLVVSYYFHSLKKIAYANTLLIAVATTQTFCFVSFLTLTQYYNSLFPFLSKNGAMILHVFIHYFPLLLIHYDFRAQSACIVLILFGIWFLSVRNIIKKIYTDKISTKQYDSIVVFSCLWYVWIVSLLNLYSYGYA